MAQSHTPVTVDPQSLKNSQENWHGFVQLMKYSLIGVIVLLSAMAFFLV